jgi:hypothetical protein
MHTNYQPARKGLIDTKITAEKALRGRKNGVPSKTYFRGDLAMIAAQRQRETLKYSDQGDFTRCYRGGF